MGVGGGQAAAGRLPRSRPWWAPQRSRASPAHTGHMLLSEGSERGPVWEGGRVRPSLTARAGGRRRHSESGSGWNVSPAHQLCSRRQAALTSLNQFYIHCLKKREVIMPPSQDCCEGLNRNTGCPRHRAGLG